MKNTRQQALHNETKRKFGNWARFYDLFELFPQAERLRGAVIEEIDRDGNILDLCCGTGTVTTRLAKARSTSQVFGLDLSSDMLNVATRKAGELPNISFMEGTAQNLPFPNSYFDAVTISFALHEMPKDERDAALKEAFRTLKTDGKIVILDVRQVTNWSKYPLSLYLRFFEPRSVFEFIKEDLEEALRETGFSSTQEKHISASRLVTGTKVVK
jgi:demethylmenaquinone methyltransferase/2-methoxy-6-polyprenyl-1,4-benzoquinol methylase